MVSDYKLIPYNTYRECLAISFKNVLTNNRWSIERALEIYHESNHSYKDYLRCKYTLLLLGPSAEDKVDKVDHKPNSDNHTAEKSSYYKEAKKRFVSLLAHSDTDDNDGETEKKKEHLHVNNDVDFEQSHTKENDKKKPTMSSSIKKQLDAYVGQTVSDRLQ